MKSGQAAARNVDEYIARFPSAVRVRLNRLRLAIRKAAPGAEETIKYRMPTFMLRGNLVYFAAFTKHIGFFPRATAMEKFRKALSGYEGGKNSVRLPMDKPIPYDVIGRIVKFRVKENLQRAKAKAKKK